MKPWPVVVILAVVSGVALAQITPAQRVQPREWILRDKQPGTPFASVAETGRRQIYFRPESITRIEIYKPNTAPDRHPWHVVYLHIGNSQTRVDCTNEAKAIEVVEFITRNQPEPKAK